MAASLPASAARTRSNADHPHALDNHLLDDGNRQQQTQGWPHPVVRCNDAAAPQQKGKDHKKNCNDSVTVTSERSNLEATIRDAADRVAVVAGTAGVGT